MDKVEQITAKINFIEVALGSFVGNPDENQRQDFVISELSSVDETLQKQLKGYVPLSKPALKDQLNKLQERKLKMMSLLTNDIVLR